jgi:hypothetical protein
MTRTVLLAAALLGGTAVLSHGTAATEAQPQPQPQPQPSFAGKTITLTIGYGPGSGNDVYGRLIGRHLGKHIPGQPNIVAQTCPAPAASRRRTICSKRRRRTGRRSATSARPRRPRSFWDHRRSSSRPRSSIGSGASAPTTTSRSSGIRRASRRLPTRSRWIRRSARPGSAPPSMSIRT